MTLNDTSHGARLELPLLRPDPFNYLVLCHTILAIVTMKPNGSRYDISLQRV